MYLILFCMHVQTTPGGWKQRKEGSTTIKIICFRIEPKFEFIPKSKKDDFKLVVKAFKELSAILIKNAINVECKEEKKMQCKKCNCVCCKVNTKSIRIFPIDNKPNS